MILLYFRQKYENDKYQELFYKKELWKYFVEIISENYNFYEYKYIPEELYIEIIKKNSINFDNFKVYLTSFKSAEKILAFINNNIDIISDFCKNKNEILYFGDLVTVNEKNDNLIIIVNELKK